MKRLILTLLPLSLGTAAEAQSWNDDFQNQPHNLRYESLSPTRLSYNSQQDFAVAKGSYQLQKGDFHAIDQSGDAHLMDVYIGGLRRVKQFSLSGHISYSNRKDNNQSWNSTLWNLADNPYTLCDSVPGDATTEAFDMQAAAAYDFAGGLKVGLSIGLRTGSRADQNDPRPRTVTSLLPITVGADYRIADSWHVGLAAGVRLSSSVIEYTSVQTTRVFRYFLMKGMGDYAKRTSADEPGYKRDYQGNGYLGALSATWQPDGGAVANHLELSAEANNEEATDGGTSYSFHGGDYAETVLALKDRLQLKSGAALHNLTLRAAYTNGKGTWYDQKRQTDIEHGSIAYYDVLSQYTNHKTQRLDASLRYQFDLLGSDDRRNLFVSVEAALGSITRKQLLGETTPKQQIQTIAAQIEAGKVLYINKVTLLAQLSGGYRTPQKQTYASGSVYSGEDNIDGDFTRRVFEYESAQCWHVGALADASMPVGASISAGLYAKCRYQRYTGKNEYWQGYDGTGLTTADFGIYIKF